MDMTGNVWEWTLSQVEGYPYQNDARNGLESTKERTLRGGAWFNSARLARVSFRNRSHPAVFIDDAGFRVVVAPVL
jgi:formylglycine-generating enzyme required for sulfatase activity